MDIVLNPNSRSKLETLKADLPHGILLTGKPGIGLRTIAKYVASSSRAAIIEPFDSKGQADHETGTISVETIRRLYTETRTKPADRRVFIIDSADRMSPGAQGAFLKLLEEPTPATHFILTAHSTRSLLQTVRSRVQTVPIELIRPDQTAKLLDSLDVRDAKTRAQLEYIAAGLPAELIRLVGDEAYFKKRAKAMTDTRTFLTGTTFEKLLIAHEYQKDKASSLQLIDSALTVLQRNVKSSHRKDLVLQLDALLATRNKIQANCNARLQLLSFVVQ